MGANRLRTFFMMLGTFVGVAALTVIMAFGQGTQRDMMDRVQRMLGGSTILLRAGGSRMVGGAHSGGPTTTFTMDDLQAIRARVPAVKLADPMLNVGGRETVWNGRSANVQVQGHTEAAEVVWNRSAARGTFFTEADVASAARVALVGEVVVRDLFAGQDPIGEQIRVGGVPFQVIGVLEPAGLDPHGIDQDEQIWIPISTMMRRVANLDYVMGAKFGIDPDANIDDTVLEISDVLRDRHRLGPDQPEDFAMFTPVQVNAMVKSANRVFTVFLPLVAAISILVGGIVVANLMLMTVNERRSEIGLRKAVGARPRDIRLQFLAESASVTGLGGIGALAVAWGVLRLIALHGRPVAGMPWSVALIGLGLSILVGIISGVIPAKRAAALDPVATLR
jgi:putative ABC transport system permease protein